MSTFEIVGGKKLKGSLTPQGAKNEALQVISAILLTKEPVTISNIPNILDVNKLIELLEGLGVYVTSKGKGIYTFQAENINIDYLISDEYNKLGAALRGSIMVLGPLLSRFGKGFLPKPGGDKIGRRRLDTHFIGFQKLGANFKYDEKKAYYAVEAKNLKGCYMLLDEASVTGTANIIMASVMAGSSSVSAWWA